MRTKGATSNVSIKLSDLNRLLQPDAVVLIARRQADQLGLTGKGVYASNDEINAAGNQPALVEKIAIQEIVEEPNAGVGDGE